MKVISDQEVSTQIKQFMHEKALNFLNKEHRRPSLVVPDQGNTPVAASISRHADRTAAALSRRLEK